MLSIYFSKQNLPENDLPNWRENTTKNGRLTLIKVEDNSPGLDKATL